MAQGLKSSGSFLTHVFGAFLGWLRWAGTLDKSTDMWTLFSLLWLDSEKEQAENKRSNRAMLRDNFLDFPDIVSAVTSAPRSKGRGNRVCLLLGVQQVTLKKSMLHGRYVHHLDHRGRYPLPCTGFQQQGSISCSYKSALHPGNSPEQGPPVGWAMQAAASTHDSSAAAAGEKRHQRSCTSHHLEGT